VRVAPWNAHLEGPWGRSPHGDDPLHWQERNGYPAGWPGTQP